MRLIYDLAGNAGKFNTRTDATPRHFFFFFFFFFALSEVSSVSLPGPRFGPLVALPSSHATAALFFLSSCLVRDRLQVLRGARPP
ncbi:hypothetical protein F5883DRAFT_59372 [Diaporthe sp. PMI_573]|nr:hypothetical protein F5883DRAFT_59372 [Diaporthaceae sp. PMI_573]